MSTATDLHFQVPTPEPTEVEGDPVEAAMLAIYETRGWVRVDKNGRTIPDDGAAKTFVYEYFRDHGVVSSDSDIVDDGLSLTDLFANTFPRAPGSTSEPLDEVTFEAYTKVSRKLWQWAGPTVRGYCQEAAEMEGLDFIMVEKKVFRTSRDASTGTGAPKQVVVRFFTANPDLIFTLSSQPATAKLVKAAEETAKHLRMNTARHPELASRVARESRSALKRSEAHLLPITSGKAQELPAGDNANG